MPVPWMLLSLWGQVLEVDLNWKEGTKSNHYSLLIQFLTMHGQVYVHHVQGLGELETTFFISVINIATSSGWNDSQTLPPQTFCSVLDCEQSLSFPSVFLAFLRATCSVELSSTKLRDAARTWRKREKKETVVVFLIFSICRLWHLFDWWFCPFPPRFFP